MKFFLAERSLNQPKAPRICIRSTNQSNRSISARLFSYFDYFVRVFAFQGHTKITLLPIASLIMRYGSKR